MFMPGLVGLAIVESYCAGLPFVAVAQAGHGPEIEYLQDGVNGVLLPQATVEATAAALVRLLGDSALLDKLVEAGRSTVDTRCSAGSMLAAFLCAIGGTDATTAGLDG